MLKQTVARWQAKSATAIVLDPRTGGVLAMAVAPGFDANIYPQIWRGYQRNRAVTDTYEPGSTFKLVTVAGALSDRLVSPSTGFVLQYSIHVADRIIHDAEPRGTETMTVAQILARSSNVGAITLAEKLGQHRLAQWISRFGFGRPTGIDLPGEERGQVLSRSKYSGSSMGNLPIGQGISVTPIQMADEYAAIANGGMLRPPRVVGAVGGVPTQTPPGKRIMSARTASDLRAMLEGVFAPGGTASEVSIPGYDLAGKTGTANKVDPRTGEYSTFNYVASFVGFAPARHPQLLCAVMVDEPQGAIYGGVVAAPAFGQIMAFALPYLRIPPH